MSNQSLDNVTTILLTLAIIVSDTNNESNLTYLEVQSYLTDNKITPNEIKSFSRILLILNNSPNTVPVTSMSLESFHTLGHVNRALITELDIKYFIKVLLIHNNELSLCMYPEELNDKSKKLIVESELKPFNKVLLILNLNNITSNELKSFCGIVPLLDNDMITNILYRDIPELEQCDNFQRLNDIMFNTNYNIPISVISACDYALIKSTPNSSNNKIITEFETINTESHIISGANRRIIAESGKEIVTPITATNLHNFHKSGSINKKSMERVRSVLGYKDENMYCTPESNHKTGLVKTPVDLNSVNEQSLPEGEFIIPIDVEEWIATTNSDSFNKLTPQELFDRCMWPDGTLMTSSDLKCFHKAGSLEILTGTMLPIIHNIINIEDDMPELEPI